MSHDVAEHHIYMAAFNRRHAHAYRKTYQAMGYEIPGQFYWHMGEAIRWIRSARVQRNEYAEIQERYNGKH